MGPSKRGPKGVQKGSYPGYPLTPNPYFVTRSVITFPGWLQVIWHPDITSWDHIQRVVMTYGSWYSSPGHPKGRTRGYEDHMPKGLDPLCGPHQKGPNRGPKGVISRVPSDPEPLLCNIYRNHFPRMGLGIRTPRWSDPGVRSDPVPITVYSVTPTVMDSVGRRQVSPLSTAGMGTIQRVLHVRTGCGYRPSEYVIRTLQHVIRYPTDMGTSPVGYPVHVV